MLGFTNSLILSYNFGENLEMNQISIIFRLTIVGLLVCVFVFYLKIPEKGFWVLKAKTQRDTSTNHQELDDIYGSNCN